MSEPMNNWGQGRNPGPGIRVLDFVRVNMPKFRRLLSNWITTEFNEKQQNVVMEKSKRIEKLFKNLGVDLDPLIHNDALKFFQYIRVVKNLPPPIMEKYLNAMVVTPVDIDLQQTSEILLDNYNMKVYRGQKITNQRRADLSENFTPAQIKTLFKFEPRELSVVRDLTRLGEPEGEYIRSLSDFEMDLYRNWGGQRVRDITLRAPKKIADLLNPQGFQRFLQEFPEMRGMGYTKRRLVWYFTKSRHALQIRSQADHLIVALRDFSDNGLDNYQSLTNEEMNFLSNINQEDFNRIFEFQERPSLPLVLNENQREVIERIKTVTTSGLNEEERRVLETIPEIFDKSSEREMKIWQKIATLTDEELGRLTIGDLDLIAVHPKLREPKSLREYVNLDGAERTRIVDSHKGSGGEEFLSGFGQSLLHEYIQANLAPTLWSGKDRKSMLRTLQDQRLNNRLMNAKLLAAAAVVGFNKNAGKLFDTLDETSLAYSLRRLQYSRRDRISLSDLEDAFENNEPESGRGIFNFDDPDDVDFVEFIGREALIRNVGTDMIELLMPIVEESRNEHLLDSMISRVNQFIPDLQDIVEEDDENEPEREPVNNDGCQNRRKRQLGFNCVDSRNEKTKPKELYKTIEKVEKIANEVGFGYTLFTIGKHIAHGDIQGISLDVLNIWAMPNLGKWITSTTMKAESPLLRMGGPMVGRVVGNFFAFVGLYNSVQEFKNAKDNFDKAIAGLHFMSNSVYIGSLWAGPYGLAISVAVFITSDIMEGILRMEQLDQKIHLTWAEKFDYLWHSFWGMSVLEEKKYYNEFIERVLSSYGREYDRVVIYLPDILVTERELVPKTSSNPVLQDWYDSFALACKGKKQIVAKRFLYEIRSIFKDFLNNDTLISRNIPDRVNGSYLTFGPTMEDVIGHPVSSSISQVDSSEKCMLMDTNEVMDAKDTIEEWAFEKNVIAYNRFGNSSITMYHIPIMTAELELFHNQPIDVYFNGMNINITGHGEPTTNKFIFTNNLTRCDIRTQGTNVFYIRGNNFTCNLTGGYNVGIVRADFEDAKDLNEIVGSEDTEDLTITYAKRVDGRGGNDTIVGNNYTVVQSHWGDWIIGKTLTILPLNVSEIDKIVYDKGFLIYNDKNEFVAIDEQSMIKTLDSFVLTPSKIGNEIHVHKFVEKNVTLEEGLEELKGIRNKKFKIVKQLSSGNYEIMLGDSGHNVFYPEKEFVNFYWEGTKDVYVFPRINANITISRANGVLDFHLLPEAYYKIVIEPQENNDFVITYDNLRVRVLNDYKNISFAMYNNRDYKLNNWKLIRDYCTKPFKITGDGMVEANDLTHSYNCFDFKSKRIMFFKVKKGLLLTSRNSSLLISNYTKNLDLAVRFHGKILITPDEFRERVKKSNIMNLYKIKDEGIEIFHNQPKNQNKIGLMDLGDRSINHFRGVIRDKDLNIEYKNDTLVLVRNWMSRPEARKIMFVFQDRTIDNEDCIVNNDCKPRAILDKFPQSCKDNVALVCLLAQHYLNKKCPLPKFRSYEKNICAEAFRIVRLIKQRSKKSVEVGEDYSLYERIVEDMRNGNYSGIKDNSKPFDSDGFSQTLMIHVRKFFNMLFH